VKPETVLGVAAGRYYDAFNGEDSIEIYWKLRKQSVLYDVPEKPWQIEGPDAKIDFAMCSPTVILSCG
jgi:aminomethyltransferase